MYNRYDLDLFLSCIKKRYKYEPEFLQSVIEFISSISSFLNKNQKYLKHSLLERIVEPERVIQFRVSWVNDLGEVIVNRAWRVQFNSSLGPYKGGMRFHPSVNLSILKFLGFEQTFKNALTNLPLGGGKGGSDFNPKGKSKSEVMRFCQSLMIGLFHYLGAYTDVPAGDIGVGEREIGFMNGMMKKLSNNTSCVFTGKSLSFGGSLIRPESTGYGLVYFIQAMLKYHKMNIEGKKVSVSGSGNVAQYAIEKCILLGAKVLTASDSNGTVFDKDGFTLEKLEILKKIKKKYGRVKDYSEKLGLVYLKNQKPWNIPVDIALPCATQNELNILDAKKLIKNGVKVVAEGANMPTTSEAVEEFISSKILFAPGKASNAGGVATSGLEMSQNATFSFWEKEKVENRLKEIMFNIHQNCLKYGKQNNYVNYLQGSNIASFLKVSKSIIEQGIL
ncbi:MAG: NADP-specific glutamate dehydrogenase [Arsenophonus sp.]|nr:MAG: NADP-specific glutamate dehydrogenase [Arsenophonus sp.]